MSPVDLSTLGQGNRVVWIAAAVVVAAVGLYYLFMAVNTLGLERQVTTSKLVDKSYREPSTTYRTQKIGDRVQAVPHVSGPAYMLRFRLDGEEAECPVEKALFDDLELQDDVRVTYDRTRVTGSLRVLDVRKP